MKLDLKDVARKSKDRYSRTLTGMKEQEESGELLEKLRGLIGKVVDLPFKYLTIGENVRRSLSEEEPEFEKLVNSIHKNGLLQNLVASLIEYDNGEWELRLAAGERRYRACKRAGLEKGPVMIRRWNSEAEEIYTGITENDDRVNLNALDLADAYARLIKLGTTIDEIAERANRQKRTIRKYLYLSRLPDDIRKIIDARPDIFTTGVLFNEVASRNFGSDDDLRNHIQGLFMDKDPVQNAQTDSESEVEDSQHAREEDKGKILKTRPIDPELIEDVISRISGAVPVKVKVKGTREKGRITISYASQEQLEGLLSRFQT